MKKAYRTLLGVISQRGNLSNHANVDCGFIQDNEWLKECEPAFHYGIAHILKHEARRQAAARDPNWQNLRRLFGWADEFFWLSSWTRSHQLRGVPDVHTVKDPYELLFMARHSFEWGDLVRDAWLCFERAVRAFCERALTDQDGSSVSFSIWPHSYPNAAEVFHLRARSRYDYAQRIIDMLDSPLLKRKNPVLQDPLGHLQGHLWLGQARLSMLRAFTQRQRRRALIDSEEAWSHLRKLRTAGKWVSLSLRVQRVVHQMEREARNRRISRPSQMRRILSPVAEPLDGPLAAIFIMAGWIEDLLLDAGERPHHPRLHMSQGKAGMQTDANFPNAPCMDELKRLLIGHKHWLRFLSQNGPSYRRAVEEIGNRDDVLRKVVSRAHSPRKGLMEDQRSSTMWGLYVLRDWGSYTPLLAPQVKPGCRPAGTGGCYFLRCGSTGIVIDPGFDFIRNFYDANLSLDMITDVIVTHDHYDHVASLGPLLNLLFIERHGLWKDFAKKQFRRAEQRKSLVNFFLSRGVLDQYARAIVDFGYFGRVEALTERDDCVMRRHVLSNGIVLHATRTVHGDINGFGRGVGLLLNFRGDLPSLGLTSDTGWFSSGEAVDSPCVNRPSLGGEFSARKRARPPEVMVLHVGSLKSDELRNSGYYKKHLGARGVFRCLSEITSCRLALLGEFGEECCDHRSWFANAIDDFFRTNMDPQRRQFRCFPTDRMTYVIAEGRKLSIGRRDRPSMVVPYLVARVRRSRDGTLTFVQTK